MKIKGLLFGIVILCLLVSMVIGCAKPAPAPAPAPTPAPAPKPAPAPAPAPAPKPYFEGKTVTLVVPRTAGGGDDISTRIIANYLGKFVPGNPTVVVNNMPGAGGILGYNHVYNVAKPDGLTLACGGMTMGLASVLKFEGVEYDYGKMTPIMGNGSELVAHHAVDILQNPDDLWKGPEGLFWGSPELPGTLSVCILVVKKALGFELEKALFTYGSSGDAWRAFQAGEINMAMESASGYGSRLKAAAAAGDTKLWFTTGALSKGDVVRGTIDPGNTPNVKELYESHFGKAPSGKDWDIYKLYMGLGLFRSYLLPPGVPADVAKTLVDAAAEMGKDPGFQTDFLKSAGGTIFVGDELKDVFASTYYDINPELAPALAEIIASGQM
ncbi:Bug family tripartite tricarboxylate transporter substrate binding protein [Chloroflexota bacterium]